jgi:hypothetical protein
MSASTCKRIVFDSFPTIVSERDVTGFPTVRAIVEAIRAEPDLGLPFANGAVPFAVAVLFRLVASRTDDGTGHGEPPRKLYLTNA